MIIKSSGGNIYSLGTKNSTLAKSSCRGCRQSFSECNWLSLETCGAHTSLTLISRKMGSYGRHRSMRGFRIHSASEGQRSKATRWYLPTGAIIVFCGPSHYSLWPIISGLWVVMKHISHSFSYFFLVFLLNRLGWHWLIGPYSFQMYICVI